MLHNQMEQAVSVTELNQYISTLMERDEILSYIQVRGEISNFKRHASGHLYFSLKDAGGVLRAVMFRADASRLTAPLQDGDKVIATGAVRNYAATGQYQLYVRSIQPDGRGALYQAFEALKSKLSKEGLFDEEHKRPIPRYPKSIGIVTSPTGAAIRDMINILSRRYPLAEAVLYPALVQGMDAPDSLINGLAYFNQHKPDVIIIGRGGGSIEDLWCFNDERLARAIYASEVPIISAVGHEIDFTISDFVADLRAPTPSAAAELAVPNREELYLRLDELASVARRHVEQLIRLQRAKLARFDGKTLARVMTHYTSAARSAVSLLEQRARASATNLTLEYRGRLSAISEKLQALSPLATLSRGYSITYIEDGERITSVNQIVVGTRITTVLTDGIIESVATSTEEKE